jgi:hypothetical protein
MTDVLLVKLAEMEALRVDVAGVQVLADRTQGRSSRHSAYYIAAFA